VIATPTRRRFSFGKFLLLLILFVLLLAVLAIGMTGVIPGLSRLVGATTARDLGVKATPADFQNVTSRMQYTLDNQPAATDPSKYRKVYTGKKPVDQVFTSEELSALLTYNHVTWWPLKDVQVKAHADGTMEVAALLITKHVPWQEFPSSITNHLPKFMPDHLPVYVKGRIDRVGPTEVSLGLERVELGRLPVPGIGAGSNAQATRYVNDRIRSIPGFTIEELSYQDGKVRFQGTFPESFKRVAITP